MRRVATVSRLRTFHAAARGGREPAQERLALTGMSDALTFLLLAAVWIALQTWILPRLGVPT